MNLEEIKLLTEKGELDYAPIPPSNTGNKDRLIRIEDILSKLKPFSVRKPVAFIVGSLAFAGNPYDGHTLRENLEQTMKLLEVKTLQDVYVDQGYSKHGCQDIADVHPVRRGWRKKKASIRKWFARRSSIEPVIGHCKQDR